MLCPSQTDHGTSLAYLQAESCAFGSRFVFVQKGPPDRTTRNQPLIEGTLFMSPRLSKKIGLQVPIPASRHVDPHDSPPARLPTDVAGLGSRSGRKMMMRHHPNSRSQDVPSYCEIPIVRFVFSIWLSLFGTSPFWLLLNRK